MSNNEFWVAFGAVSGSIGTVTGIAALIISWFNHRYNTPNIKITAFTLTYPDYLPKHHYTKTEDYYADLTLDVIVKNSRGGSGSIDKPKLVIRLPDGKHWRFLPKYKDIKLNPRTKSYETIPESESVSRIITHNHGKAFNLTGGGTVDDSLDYTMRGENVVEYIKHFNSSVYCIEYHNNFGKKKRIRIKELIKASDSYR